MDEVFGYEIMDIFFLFYALVKYFMCLMEFILT